MKGSVKIKKVFRDGSEELVLEDHNIITKGMGRSITSVLSNNVPDKLSDMLIGYYQIGAGNTYPSNHEPETRPYIYQLANPLLEAQYGDKTNQVIDIHNQLYPTKGNFSPDSALQSLKATFVELSPEYHTKITDDSVHYRLVIDKETANGVNIRELGLFSKNPDAESEEKSILVAYKTTGGIEKSDLFDLVVDWNLKFVAETREVPLTQNFTLDGQDYRGLNVVLIMADDLGVDQLGMYDSINPYDLSNAANANTNPFSNIDDPVNGSCIYPHTPMLSAMGGGGPGGVGGGGVTFFNARANAMCSPTRANILTGRNGFNSPSYNAGEGQTQGFWGHGVTVVMTSNPQKMRGGLKGLNDGYYFYNTLGEYTNLDSEITSTDNVNSDMTSQLVIADALRNTRYCPSAYQSAMVGKWHLAEFSSIECYREFGPQGWKTTSGNGWAHIAEVGKWDDYRAMFHNLNKPPIPGYSDFRSGISQSSWVEDYTLSDSQMGYVNYFINKNGVIHTVSDAGWTTTRDSNGNTLPGNGGPNGDRGYYQGSASNYATTKTFAEASAVFKELQEPFFLYVPLNAPHSPYTYPPSGHVWNQAYFNGNHAQTRVTNELTASASWVNINAMIENIDFELSSFMTSLNADSDAAARKNRTIFIFMGDNGTDPTWVNYMNTFAGDDRGGTEEGSQHEGLQTASGLGPTYTKVIEYEDYLPWRRGGNLSESDLKLNKQPGSGFKSSVYNRGTLIPMFVSGPFFNSTTNATASNAIIDVVDIYPTILDIAGADLETLGQDRAFDGFSFLPLLRGDATASGHSRQFSFHEVVRPAGNTVGNRKDSGTYTGFVSSGQGAAAANLGVEEDISGVGNPTLPYDRRRGFAVKLDETELGTQLMPGALDPNSVYHPNNADYSPVPEVSAGLWHLVRPTSGTKYDELYHVQNNDFTNIDDFELRDLIPSGYKGGTTSLLSQILAAADPTDSTDSNWILARIYASLSARLSSYLSKRLLPSGNLNILYEGFEDEAQRESLPVVDDTDRLNRI